MPETVGRITLKPNKPSEYIGRADKVDIETWICQLDAFFFGSNLNFNNPAESSQATRYAASCLRKSAAEWYRFYSKTNDVYNMPYPEFRQALLNEFLDPNAQEKAREQLRVYKQGSKSFNDYVKGFREIT